MNEIFSIGNILTLGIVAAAFLLSRFLDKHDRSITLARNYGRELKEDILKELEEFTEVKAAALRDYGIILDGDFKRAEALKKNIEDDTADIEKKLETVRVLNVHVKKYESAIKELDEWTTKVEENLRRIRSESEFVGSVAEKTAEAKTRLEELHKGIDEIERRIETETEHSVKKTTGQLLQPMQAAIDKLKDTAEAIAVGIGEHREALDRADEERRQIIERDLALINEGLKKVLEVAADSSNEMEARFFRELTEASEKRNAELRQSLEQKISVTEQTANDTIADIENALASAIDIWKKESASIIDEQQNYRDEWQDKLSALDAELGAQRDIWQKTLVENDAAIEQYRQVQTAQMMSIESTAEDASKMEQALRQSIENVTGEIKNNFAAFEAEMKQNYAVAAEDFDKSIDGIKNKIETLENEITGLKDTAYERVSESLKEFERQVEDNLAKRSETINAEMNEWRDGISRRIGELNESAEEECRKIEHECGDTLRQKKDALDASFDEEVKRIKDAFDTLSGNIITQTERYGTSVKSLEEQLQNAIEDAKRTVGSTLNTEISRLELENTERLKKHERDTENALRDAALDINVRLNKITDMTNKSYNDIEAYKAECMERLNELNASIEGISRHADERIKSFEDFISESKNSIDEFFGKTDLIDKAIAVKKDVEQKIDDLNADMDKLALRGAELAELKVQFERANRMEEELNNKMTRFDIEQQRIERMESNFNRLLKTSQSVEERIKYITDSDDKLQEAQIKIRKLGDAMTEAEEKYQRIEKKNKILEETNDGIDNNLKALQESEAAVQKIIGDTRHLEADIKDMRTLIETLAGENIKAKDTFQKLETLDKDIAYIDSRIQSIQKARVWVADLETRIDEKSREMQRQSKLTDDTAKKQSGGVADTEDAYSPRIRDNVITLKRKGWGIDEIGNSLNISRAAVELILETWHGDK